MKLTRSNIQITLWHTQWVRGLLLVTGEDIGTFAENGFVYEAGREKFAVVTGWRSEVLKISEQGAMSLL